MRKMTLTFEVVKQPASPQQEIKDVRERWWLELLKADIPILPELICAEENFPKEPSGNGGVGCPVGGGADG